MPHATFQTSEADYVAAQTFAFRAQRWTVRLVQVGLAGAAILLAYAGFRLASGDRPGELTIELFLMFAVAALYGAYKRRWGWSRHARRLYRQSPNAGGEIAVAWTDEALTFSDSHTSQSHPWAAIRAWRDDGPRLLLWLADGAAIAIPVAALDGADMADLKARLGTASRGA